MNLKNPQECCRQWQQLLKLQDWDVSVTIESLDNEDIEGDVTWVLEKKFADIRLTSEHPDAMRPYDMEQTLVHDLLHLHFAPFDAKSKTVKAIAQEQTINAIASALVNLKRQIS